MQQGGPRCLYFIVTNQPAEVTSSGVCRTEAGNATAHSDEWIMSPRMVDPCPWAWGAIHRTAEMERAYSGG